MGGLSPGGAAPASGERPAYPILIVGPERTIGRMLLAICHATGLVAGAATSSLDGLDYLANHREPHVLILGEHPGSTEIPATLRYLNGNPALRRRVAVIMYVGFDIALQQQLAARQWRLVDAWLRFPPSFESLHATLQTASAALSARLAARRARES